jgi:tetratricopeptide (TPR) repeat protein
MPVVRVAALVAVSGLVARGLAAQIPEKFTNLEVLPADISRPALVMAMRRIAGSLSFRCNNCHVGGDPNTLEGVDFASDSLETKRIARQMMRMVKAINRDYLAGISDSADRVEVTCLTCHRGVTRPEAIPSIMTRLTATRGLGEAIAEYRRLRDRYYGSDAYDFSDLALRILAESMATSGARDQALEFLELNLEYYPKSSPTVAMMGRITIAKGDTARGVELLRQALALAPDDRFLARELERLGGKP